MSDDDFRTGADWASLIEDYEDTQDSPDPSSMAAVDISRQLGALRRLYAHLGSYEQLHLAEVERLEARRDVLTGPLVERIQRIEAALRQYALRSFLDFGKTGTILATPNGVIRASRELVPELSIDHAEVAKWIGRFTPNPAAVVEMKPVVRVAQFRPLLAKLEQTGELRRAIICDGGEPKIIEPGTGFTRPFDPGEVGVWLDRDNLALVGVTWEPSGVEGCGHDFTIVAI